MKILTIGMWVLYIGFIISVIYGIISYVWMKCTRARGWKEKDEALLKENFLAIQNSMSSEDQLQASLKARHDCSRYDMALQIAVEEKKQPRYSENFLRTAKNIRLWWLITFCIYYALNIPFLYQLFAEEGFQQGVLMVIANFMVIYSLYYCAYKKHGWRLLFSFNWFVAVYLFVMGFIAADAYRTMAQEALHTVENGNVCSSFLLPLIVLFVPLILYWVASICLTFVNRKWQFFEQYWNMKEAFTQKRN